MTHSSYSGVYWIRNQVNGKLYVGSSCNIQQRHYAHISSLRLGNHHSLALQRAFDKYGEDNFIFETLLICDEDLLLLYEQTLLDEWVPEYNIAPDAQHVMLGRSHSEDTKKKISIAGRNISDETRRKMSESAKRRGSPNKGKQMSDEQKRKISEGLKGNTNASGKRGKDFREKISRIRTGSTLSEEHKRNISDSLIGNKRNLGNSPSEETRKKLSKALKGRKTGPLSEDRKRKISESLKAYYRNKQMEPVK